MKSVCEYVIALIPPAEVGYPVGFESLCPLRRPSTLMAFVVNIFVVGKEGRLEVGGALGWVRDIGDPHHGPAGGRGGDYPCGVVGWDGGVDRGQRWQSAGTLHEACACPWRVFRRWPAL